jgi:hypothetical protein
MGRMKESIRNSCFCCKPSPDAFADDDNDDDGPHLGLGRITYDKPSSKSPSEPYAAPKKQILAKDDKVRRDSTANGKGPHLEDSDLSDSDDDFVNPVHGVKTSECGRVTASLTSLAPSSGIVTSGLQPLQVCCNT